MESLIDGNVEASRAEAFDWHRACRAVRVELAWLRLAVPSGLGRVPGGEVEAGSGDDVFLDQCDGRRVGYV